MTVEEAVQALFEIDNGTGEADPELAHGEADYVLYQFAPAEVQKAYDDLCDRVTFWYA
ncbi:hypothetical protein [Actinomadura sp. KC216]|uniref:hypothetical protein n=1 Tax=Actinomadura sp. KC216 TaxID=2530370 RepID=UPI0014042CB1|nr:hypothetical protein [Actinomadura sp. KC216]